MRVNGFLLLAAAVVMTCQQPSVGQAAHDIQFVNWGPSQQAPTPAPAGDTTVTGCGESYCGEVGSCDLGCCEPCCPPGPCCAPCWYAFGEFLFLRPRSTEVVYGTVADGPLGAVDDIPVQVAPLRMIDAEYEPGFRVGAGVCVDEGATLEMKYTWFESSEGSVTNVPGNSNRVLISNVSHPATVDVTRNWLDAVAHHDVDFQLVDLDYRSIFLCGPRFNMTYFAGFRYGRLEQRFDSVFSGNGTESNNTEIFFDGGGIRLGLEMERHSRCTGWMVYGKSAASFLGGSFDANYVQTQSFDPDVVATSWKAGRLVSMLELELGLGWKSRCDNFRVTTGYTVSAWHNVVTTDEWIQAVRSNNYTGLDDMVTFDGWVTRCEVRY